MTAPSTTRAKLDRVVELLGEVDESDILGLGDEDLVAALDGIGRARRSIGRVGVLIAGRVERSTEGVVGESIPYRKGERDAAALVALTARVPLAEARAWCTVGTRVLARRSFLGERLESEFAATMLALGDGTVSVAAALRITDAVAESARVLDKDRRDRLETELIVHARHLTDRDLARLCRTVPDMIAPDDAEFREERLRRRAGLTISRAGDGLVKWTVVMDAEAAGFLTAALDARTAPRRSPTFAEAECSQPELFADATDDDDRNPGRKRLDALVSLARDSLGRDNGQVAGSAVTMVVTVGLDELRTGIGSATIDAVDEPISAKTARRLACDAKIVPMVLGGRGEPLELGRAARLFSEPQRRLIARRDGGCSWPGCGAPPGWCEIGHVTPWARGGPTDVENAIMLRLSREWRAVGVVGRGRGTIGRGRQCAFCGYRSAVSDAAFGAGLAS